MQDLNIIKKKKTMKHLTTKALSEIKQTIRGIKLDKKGKNGEIEGRKQNRVESKD